MRTLFRKIHRRILFGSALLLFVAIPHRVGQAKTASKLSPPNILFVIADQWRFEAFGYAGNPDVRTPHFDQLQRESVHFVNAVAGMPVCSPTRASFLTGQRPLTHGVFLNDVQLNPNAATLAKVLRQSGYDTGCIGKWHLDGDGRSNFIPAERRQGFDYWKVLECTHDYSNSFYYADTPEKLKWSGYDAFAQTRDAGEYLRNHRGSGKPFFLMLSWGPPHNPYETAPANYRALYDPATLTVRGNVPAAASRQTKSDLAGYYAHCTALDECLGQLRQTLDATGLATNTLIIFTADHGDMLGSHGLSRKQKPYDESIRVPLLFHWPSGLGRLSRQLQATFNSEDMMPTLLGLCGVKIPKTVEGIDYSDSLRGGKMAGAAATVILCAAPFGEWDRQAGGREYRGVRTTRYTYVRDLNGPWLMFDNESDPLQTNNLVNLAGTRKLQEQLEATLKRKLREQKDELLPGEDYIRKWGYTVNNRGTVPYGP